MPLNLVEDAEAFAAALNYVDEYVGSDPVTDDDAALALALDGLPSPGELALVDSYAAASPEPQSGSTKKGAKSTPKRPLNYDPNRARNQKRKELLYLREKVVELEQELKALQSTRRPKTLKGDTDKEKDAETLSASSGCRAPGVWKEMASHQLEQRLKSERENHRLKTVLEGQIKIGKSLAKLLEATSTTEPMQSCLYGLPRARSIYASVPDPSGPGIFAELMAGVDNSYREVDDVFQANGLGDVDSSFSDAKMRVGPDGMYMEIFDSKVLPFDVVSTGNAAWQFFANSMERGRFRSFYQSDLQNLEARDDTVVESFAIEIQENETEANFRVKQILRRYVEEDRMVIVWRSVIDPVNFSDVQLRGAKFRENGYIVVRRPRGLAENFAVLQTYDLIQSHTLGMHTLVDVDAITSALADFKLSRTAANIATGHQKIENSLFNEARKTCTPCSQHVSPTHTYP